MIQNSFIRFVAKIYQWIISVFSNLQSVFLFILRITWGHQLFLAGYGKFQNLSRVGDAFADLGIPLSHFNASLVAGFELVGGLLLIFGFASRLISIPLTVIMMVAYSTAHSHVFTGFQFIFDPSLIAKEAPFAFLMTTLIVLIFGPGRISIDAYIKRKIEEKKV